MPSIQPLKGFIVKGSLPALVWLLTACTQNDLYEKTAAIPGHAWQSSFKPAFTFTIKDTAAAYRPYLILRHSDKYGFKNIYVKITMISPAGDTLNKGQQPIDLSLADDQNGWKGDGMDDIYEHRVKLSNEAVSFHQKGNYTFIVQQVMRENPLPHVFDAGIRIEKVN